MLVDLALATTNSSHVSAIAAKWRGDDTTPFRMDA
jgi:hypothetical protein